MSFRTSRRVEFVDTDMAGIAHFSNFFRWMEAAEVDFLRSRGLSVRFEHQSVSLGFPRVGASCDFSKPVRFGDVLDIDVTVEKIGRSSVTYGFDFSCAGEPIARGRVSAACCRILPGKALESVEIPSSIRELLTAEAP